MRRILFQILAILTCFLLQTAFFRYFDLAGVVPNLLLIPTVSFGMMRGRKEGMIVGCISGFLVDLMYGGLLGPYTLLYMYLGYINGFFHRVYYMEDILLPMLMVGANDFVFNITVYVFAFMLRNRLDFPFYFVHIMLPEAIYTMLMALIIYKPLVRLNKWLKKLEEGSEA